MMTSSELRQKFIDFFKQKKHAVILSASLIPENDPSVLFTTAGMHPLALYLLGEKHPAGNRLVGVQKCIRTSDIDDVGDNRHLTFFEMLGNWSLGGYFKNEAIEWSFEFLTSKKWLGLNPGRLYVTVFRGDAEVPLDEESIKSWKEQFESAGLDAEVSLSGEWEKESQRIFALGKDDNWWGLASGGPCGPCSEMFYDVFPERGHENKNFKRLVETGRFVEIWNDVFMEYEQIGKDEKIPRLASLARDDTLRVPQNDTLRVPQDDTLRVPQDDTLRVLQGDTLRVPQDDTLRVLQDDTLRVLQGDTCYRKLGQKNVDTGMGLERTVAILNGKKEVFDIAEFQALFDKISELSEEKYADNKREFRIIADHLRAAVFILAEGAVEPSNVKQGYVLRRLIRRAVRYGRQMGIDGVFTFKIAEVIIDSMKKVYPELKKNKDFIVNQLVQEEEKFSATLERGLREFQKIAKNKISGKDAFILFSSYGFPLEMTLELAKESNVEVDQQEFDEEFKKHQELSRTASAGMFKGGLSDSSEETKRLHTAAHLMLEALRRVLGNHVEQRGSNITPERLRFDFSHPQKLALEEIKQVENLVNEQIQKKLPVRFEEMSVEEAKKNNAVGVFEHKYGEKVKVYSINEFSREICGGPHVENTGELGQFKIVKEESSSSGVRRIKAMLS